MLKFTRTAARIENIDNTMLKTYKFEVYTFATIPLIIAFCLKVIDRYLTIKVQLVLS